MASPHETEHAVHHPSTKQYVLIATILFAITIVEFVLIWDRAGIDDNLGASKVPLLIFLSAIKFAIVILFYMHLKFDNKFFMWVFLAGLGLAFMVGLALLGLFTGIKGESREYAEARAVPFEEHEAEGVAGVEDEHVTGGGVTPTSTAGAWSLGVAGEALQFDIGSLSAAPGQEVTVTFNNSSVVNQHNWVLVEAGTKDDVAAAGTAAGPDNDWLAPGDARVIANTPLLDPGASGSVTFTAPGAGTYQFVCTFPGHNFTMFGDFVVSDEGAAPAATEDGVTGPASAGGGVSLSVGAQGEALQFDVSTMEASSDSEVTVTFTNPSVVNQHNWVLVEAGTKDAVAADGTAAGPDNAWVAPGDSRVIANTELLGPGASGSVTFMAPAPGTYQFVCTFPGHNFTMFGDFVVN